MLEGSHGFTCHPHVYPRMKWTILPLLRVTFTRWHHPREVAHIRLQLTNLAGSKVWKAELAWLADLEADGLPTLVVADQLQIERRTVKVRWSQTDVLPLPRIFIILVLWTETYALCMDSTLLLNTRCGTSWCMWYYTRGLHWEWVPCGVGPGRGCK